MKAGKWQIPMWVWNLNLFFTVSTYMDNSLVNSTNNSMDSNLLIYILYGY